LRADRLVVPDYGDFGNSIAPPDLQIPPTPSHVSFDVRWKCGGKPTDIDDDTFDFSGTFLDQAATPSGVPDGLITIEFAARHDGSNTVYRNDDGAQHVVSGGVGRERNGVFH